MKKILRLGIVGAILMIIIIIVGTSKILDRINEDTKEYESYLGQEYIFGNDTVTIVNYSRLHDDYILSNGAEISASIIRSRD